MKKNTIGAGMLIGAMILLAGCSGKKAATPVFQDGMAQPVFPYTEVTEDYDNKKSAIVRYCVWVETDNDMDRDGEKDLVKALVQLPRAAYEGAYKAATIFEARPYIAGRQFYQLSDPELQSEKAVIAPEAWYYENPFVENDRRYEDLNWYDYFLVRGFAFVASAGPGTLGSDGYVSLGSAEETDAFASVIEWLHGDRIAYTDLTRNETIRADWSNGKVGMTGKSYGGTTQYALAARGVEGLETVVPVSGITSWYQYLNGQGVSLEVANRYFSYLAQRCCSKTFNAAAFAGERDAYINYLDSLDQQMLELDGNYGEVWVERDFNTGFERAEKKTPILIVHGLNDNNVRTNQLERLIDILQDRQYEYKLLLTQGGHQVPADPTARSEIMIGEQSYDELLNKWFSHYLYGIDNGIENMPTVRYQSNVDGSWRAFEPETLMLKPVEYTLESAEISSEALPKAFDDWNENVWYKRDDQTVKRYELAVAGEDGIELCKQVKAELTLSLDSIPENTENLMVTACLVDEYEDPFGIYLPDKDAQVETELLSSGAFGQVPGYSAYDGVQYKQTLSDHKLITAAWFDLCNPGNESTPENSMRCAEPVRCGETYEYTVLFDPTIYTVVPGHKLVLYIFGYDLDRITVNTVMKKIPQSFYDSLDNTYVFTINEGSGITVPVKKAHN